MLKESVISSFFLSDEKKQTNVTSITLAILSRSEPSNTIIFQHWPLCAIVFLLCSLNSLCRRSRPLWQQLMVQWCWSNTRYGYSKCIFNTIRFRLSVFPSHSHSCMPHYINYRFCLNCLACNKANDTHFNIWTLNKSVKTVLMKATHIY